MNSFYLDSTLKSIPLYFTKKYKAFDKRLYIYVDRFAKCMC